jgi:membrane associated rhomboid family serine protease
MRRLQYNAPVVLTFSLLALLAWGLGELTGGITTQKLFSVYRSSLGDPLTYFRFFGHALGHSGFAHYSGNILMILILGPMVEERYGSFHTFLLMAVTALATGIVHWFVSPYTALLGASGIVFMLIFLASLAGMRKNRIPLTLVAVTAIYFGQEIYNGLFTADNISHLTHIIGGVCGVVLGLFLRQEKRK